MYEREIFAEAATTHHNYLLFPGGYSKTSYREGCREEHHHSRQKQHLDKKTVDRLEVFSLEEQNQRRM